VKGRWKHSLPVLPKSTTLWYELTKALSVIRFPDYMLPR
jgi:hypothetical protein